MLDYNTLNALVEKGIVNKGIEKEILDKIITIIDTRKWYTIYMQRQTNTGTLKTIGLVFKILMNNKPSVPEDVLNYIIDELDKIQDSMDKLFYVIQVSGFAVKNDDTQLQVFGVGGYYAYPGATRNGIRFNTPDGTLGVSDAEFKDSTFWTNFKVYEN